MLYSLLEEKKIKIFLLICFTGGIAMTFIQQLSAKLWDMSSRTKKTVLFFLPISGSQIIEQTLEEEKQKQHTPKKRNRAQRIGLALGPLLFLFIMLFVRSEGLSKEAISILASTIWIAVWWITEAIPIPVTSLLPIVLFPLTGAISGGVTSTYADSTIFLFLGGFIIAITLEKWGLHKRIALNIILLVGTSTKKITLGIMMATGFLSMWISNTATAIMMMPIALSIIKHVSGNLQPAKREPNFGKAIMLGVAYAASIGGLGTLIGTPPNTIFVGIVRELYGVEISFAKWMLFGVPVSIVLLFSAWLYLVKLAFPVRMKFIPGGREMIVQQKSKLGKMSDEEKIIAIVFLTTAIAWITRAFILEKFIPGIDDTMIAIIAAILLFLIPSKNARDGRLANWDDAKQIPWDVLLLFGGGLAIAKGFSESGLAKWIGEQLNVLQGIPLLLIVFAVAVLVLFLTEITSNTATATMMFPIMASFGLALNVHPYVLMITAGISASCAFMLPVATPPNAIVFGTGLIKIQDMARAGFWINMFCILIIPLFTYFFLPMVWGIDITVFPENFR